MRVLIKSLPCHQAIAIAAFSAILMSFCATRNVFFLRFIPCIVVAEISRVLLIWVNYLLNTREAEFMRDIYLLIAGRIKKEAHKTIYSTGRRRRRVETQILGVIHQFHGLWFDYAENYLEKISTDAKKRREMHTNDFLHALKQGKKESEDAVIHAREKIFRMYRFKRKNGLRHIPMTARSA